MKFELVKVDEKDKSVIFNLMQLYTYELSFYEDETTEFTLQDTGLYKMSKYLDLYWTEESRHPYILLVDDKLAGFVLYRLNEEGRNDIAEFFVINKYRNIGAGTFMANKIFELYKGEWEIRTLLKNLKAQSFWRNVVDKESDGNFKEGLTTDNSRYAFYFKN